MPDWYVWILDRLAIAGYCFLFEQACCRLTWQTKTNYVVKFRSPFSIRLFILHPSKCFSLELNDYVLKWLFIFLISRPNVCNLYFISFFIRSGWRSNLRFAQQQQQSIWYAFEHNKLWSNKPAINSLQTVTQFSHVTSSITVFSIS